jgi:hypothetical protein
MHRYAVGELYNPAVTRWPETPHLRLFGFDGGGAELVLFFRDPTPREVEAFRTGRAEYARATAHVADAAVNELYRRHPHTDSLVKAATARCVGGQG